MAFDDTKLQKNLKNVRQVAIFYNEGKIANIDRYW